MKKLIVLLLFLLPISARATTTVTGNLQNLGTATVGQGAYVRFWLRGCGGNIPRVNGTALIAPSQGGVYYFDIAATSGGVISGTLYSTRDSTGLLGGDIECGGVKTAVWYGLQVYVGGKGGVEIPIHAKSGVTLDITQVSPITATPPIPASGLAAGTVPDLINYSGASAAGDSGIPASNGKINANLPIKGPIPWRDVSSYMPFNNGNFCSSTDTSNGANTTGTISLATPTALTLAAAKDFKSGCGIAILGAGPLPTITTPPSTLSISSVSGNGTTVTITTTANHGIAVGSSSGVVVSGCTGGSGTFNGTFPFSATDSTHLTYSATGNGTPSSCAATVMFGYAHGTGGSTTYKYQVVAVDGLMGLTAASSSFTVTSANATLSKYNYNQIFWTCPASGSIACGSSFTPSTVPYTWLIYGDKGLGGALSCLGTAETIGYSDQGFAYGCPAYAPSSPPVSPVAQALSTTISAGAGTTTLTLAAAATTAVTSANIYHDESSFVVSCLNDQKTDQATFNTYGCMLPSGRWWLSTFSAPNISGEMRLRASGSIVAHAMPLFFPGGYKVESIGSGGGGGNFDIMPQTSIELGSSGPPAAVVTHGGGVTVSGFTVNFPAQDIIWSDAGGSSELRFANLSTSLGVSNFGSSIHVENLVGGEIDHVSLNSASSGGQQLIDFAISPYSGSGVCCVNISNLFTSGHGIGFRAPGGSGAPCSDSQININNWLMENEDPLDDSIVQIDTSADAPGTGCSGVSVQYLSGNNVNNSDTAFVYRNFIGFIGTPALSSGNISLTNSDGLNNAAVCVTQVTNCNPLTSSTSINGYQNTTYSKTAIGLLSSAPLGYNVSQGLLEVTDTSGGGQGFAMMMPSPNASVFSTGAGSLAAGTYCAGFTGLDNRPTPGETNLSNISCQTVGASSSITYHGNDGYSNGSILFAYSNKNFYYCIVATGTFCDPNQNLGASPTKQLATGTGAGGGWSYTFTSTAGAASAVPPPESTAMMSWLGLAYQTAPASCFFCVLSHSDSYPVGFGIVPTVNTGYNIFTKLGVNVGTTLLAGTSVTAPTISTNGTTAGLIALTGSASNPAIPSNSAGWLAPPSASFTSYVGQLPSTAPSGGQVPQCGTPASNISTCTWVTSPVTIAASTATMTTALIASLACGTTVTVSASGVATTDSIAWAFNAAPAANPGELVVSAWPTANNVNFQYCNPTAGGVTPNAATLNWRVTR